MAEKEYIERDSIYRRVKAYTNPYGKPMLDYKSGIEVLDMIKQEPAADVVPKSEIDAWAELYAASQKKWETAYEECESKVRAETAREIFAEIEKMAITPFRYPNVIVIHEQKIVGLDRIIALKKIFTEDLK